MAFRPRLAKTIGQIGRLKETLYRLSEAPRRVAFIAAPLLDVLLKRQFLDGVDPYGRPWAPLKPATLRKHGPPPLTDTGVLRDGTLAKPKAQKGIQVEVGASYGQFHQTGFVIGRTRVPPRRILPQFGMPKAWSDILKQAAREAVHIAVRGRS